MKTRLLLSALLITVIAVLWANALSMSHAPQHKKEEVVVSYGIEMKDVNCADVRRAIEEQKQRGGRYVEGRFLMKFVPTSREK